MRNALLGSLCTLILLVITTCNQTADTIKTETQYETIKSHVTIPCVAIKEEDKPTVPSEAIEYISVDVMADEIAQVWEIFFDDQQALQSDPRRKMFDVYAKEIAEAIDYYKKNETNIGGQLPNHRSTHIIIAIMITRESSVNPATVGKRHKEVSLFQLWGKALNGYPPEVVKKSTELAASLGVRWFAYGMTQCNNNRVPTDRRWQNEDWLRPITAYGAKRKSLYKNRKKKECRIFPFARRRIITIQTYAERIDSQQAESII